MKSGALPRTVLLVALAGLAGSVAVFTGVTGVTSATVSESTHEFAIQDERLVEIHDGTTRTLLDDLSTVERIEITDIGTDPVVTTGPRDPPALSRPNRKRAKRIVTAEETGPETLHAPEDAVYTIRPIPIDVESDEAAIIGADSDATWDRLTTDEAADFVVRNGTAPETVVLERTDPQMSDQRALVVVDPLERNIRYSVVVGLETETIEAFVRLRGANE
jgi:hypothetical protein